MPDFSLTDEQRAFQRLAHEFAQKEIVPVAAHYDRTAEFPWPIVKKAHELGLMNPNVPAEYGGPGLSLFEEILQIYGARLIHEPSVSQIILADQSKIGLISETDAIVDTKISAKAQGTLQHARLTADVGT